MKLSLLLPIVVSSAALFLAGCASNATYVDQGSNKMITTVGKINIQDFERAADEMVKSITDNLISPGKLKSGAPPEPALLAISRIVNSTGQQLETDLLVKKIRVALNRTGLIQTSTAIGLDGPEDPLVKSQQHARLPDYSLSGKIIELKDNAGNVRQSSYVFQLTLSSKAGVGVWEEERTITKQGKRDAVGF